MNEKEKLIREQRTIEATRKGFMGMDGKFGTILKQLGFPIIAHSGGMYEETQMPNYWQLPEELENEDMDTMDENEPVTDIGLYFDALSSGIHLEIKYIIDRNELQVTYKGHLVYCEISGDLDCYMPLKEWEDSIDGLYAIAKRKEHKNRHDIKQEHQEEVKKEKLGFLEKLRARWGI